eukprot:scaffold9737_cov72-Phaeocystis_antarctica.AAC.2
MCAAIVTSGKTRLYTAGELGLRRGGGCGEEGAELRLAEDDRAAAGCCCDATVTTVGEAAGAHTGVRLFTPPKLARRARDGAAARPPAPHHTHPTTDQSTERQQLTGRPLPVRATVPVKRASPRDRRLQLAPQVPRRQGIRRGARLPGEGVLRSAAAVARRAAHLHRQAPRAPAARLVVRGRPDLPR